LFGVTGVVTNYLWFWTHFASGCCLFEWFDVDFWLVDLALILSFARCLGFSVCPSCVICNNDGRFGSGATDGALSG